jgi:hypothetical protein
MPCGGIHSRWSRCPAGRTIGVTAMDPTQTLVAYNQAWTESTEVEIRAGVECWVVDSTTWFGRWRRKRGEQVHPGPSVGRGCSPIESCPRGAS